MRVLMSTGQPDEEIACLRGDPWDAPESIPLMGAPNVYPNMHIAALGGTVVSEVRYRRSPDWIFLISRYR